MVSLCTFGLYVATLAPTVLYYERPILLDSAMLQVQAIVLGIPGGTGSPSWVMLTHLFTHLPVGDPAYRTNLSSAAYAASAVGMVYVAGYLLSRKVIAAAVGALAFGFGTTLWSQAVMAEVYPLNAVLVMLPIIALLVWRETRRDRYLLFACFLMGFALTNHITSGLVVPAAFIFVGLVEWRKLVEWRLAIKGAGLFFVGLLPYLYLPVRSSMNPPLDEWSPTNFERFWYLVSGGDHHVNSFAFGPAEIPGRFALYLDYLFQNFHWSLVMAAIVGMALMAIKDRPAAALLFFLWAGWTFHAIEYEIFDFNLYFITTYTMAALMVACGAAGILEAVEDFLARFPDAARIAAVGAVSVLLLALPVVKLPNAYAENDMSEDYQGRETIEAVAENAEPNAMVLHHRSSLWYMVLVEERRRDLTLADPWPPGRARHTDIVWPDDIDHVTTNLRYGTNDHTGVSTARTAGRDGAAVYILDQESAGPQNFEDAGFDIFHVENILFELIPPDSESYAAPEEDIASAD
ncbi:MAG: protein O-mannosyl-transferase family [Rubrobacteraceae bacterium]